LTPGAQSRRTDPRLRLLRLFGLLVLAAVSFAGGIRAGSDQTSDAAQALERFVQAWERDDWVSMHAALTPAARDRTGARRLKRAYARLSTTATIERVRVARPLPEPHEDGRPVHLRVTLQTRVFGAITGTLELPVGGEDEMAGVDWRSHHAFPGMRRGQRLTRETTMPSRAAILTRDGQEIAAGPDRLSDLGSLAAEIAGRLGPAPAERQRELAALGVPPETPVGLNGLEREFDIELLGRPGGVLRLGGRLIAERDPEAAQPVRTTIDPKIQAATVTALAGRFGGVAALDPATGEVLGLAGIAFSAPQPPGSVFKIVTLTGALERRVVKPGSSFPFETFTTLEGVKLRNAHDESCGGSLRAAFAVSCNSVFAPMGAKLGAEALVETAERFGFNQEPSLRGAARSTIPPAGEIIGDLDEGSTAIGQGRVLATPLLMASVAAAIGNHGSLVPPTLKLGRRGKPVRATTQRVAHTVTRLMRGVVENGTGVGARIDGVRVAGKTGTAELRSTVPPDDAQPGDESAREIAEDTTDTNAWFAAFAPAGKPRIAVAVMLIGQGAGGETAAPVARAVLLAGLKKRD
jgi:cell division protein FtsI/penicillin-binding protein 2